MPHFLPVWKIPLTDDQGKARSVNEYKPRVQISRLFKEGSLNIEDNAAITNFSVNYAVVSELVKNAIEHLDFRRREAICANKRKLNQQQRSEKKLQQLHLGGTNSKWKKDRQNQAY